MNQYAPATPEELEFIRIWWTRGLRRKVIAQRLGRSEDFVSSHAALLPDNGTRTSNKRTGWPEVDTLPEEVLSLHAYKDVGKRALRREWPHTIPMNGDRLKFAAWVKDLRYGVSEVG